MRRWTLLLMAAALMVAAAGCGTEPEPYKPTPVSLEADGFPEFSMPGDNPLTQEGIDLGRRLFFDPILSGDSTLACAGCHQPQAAFADPGKALSQGIHGDFTERHTPAIINALWLPELFWEGRAFSLENQATFPVPSEIEMDLPWDQAVKRLNRHPDYPDLFARAFGAVPISEDLAVKAIAQFQRTLISNNSRFDRAARGEIELSPAERRGKGLFFSERADCFHCHGQPLFTDMEYHNNGLDATFTDLGREDVTGKELDEGKFKTPTLRNLVFTPPYMHDGRFATLEEAIQHYNSGGVWSPTVSPLIRVNGGLGLNDDEVADLTAFLLALTDSSFVTNPDFQSPFP